MPKKITTSLPSPVAAAAPTAVVDVLPPPVTKPKRAAKPKTTIRIHNNLRQMVPLNIRDASGVTRGIEIPAYGDVIWPYVAELGPDVMIKVRQKYLTIY